MARTEELTDAVVVTVNGRARSVAPGTTVAGLLQNLELDPQMVVVEHNREILRDRGRHDERMLATGDTIEIVHFVGGG